MNAQTGSCHVCQRGEDGSWIGSTGAYVCLCATGTGSRVIESAADQSWAEFCGTLEKPAFLLAITGFGELE